MKGKGNCNKHSLLVSFDLDLVMAFEPEELAAEASANVINVSHTEIYDSGCSKHLTPYKDNLENFVKIKPKPFCAANKQ